MMSELSNAFSLLDVDVEDDKKQISAEIAKRALRRRDVFETWKKLDIADNNGKSSNGTDGESQQSTAMLTGKCKASLVWIDLEMTGLDIEVDRIIEIACIVTDGHLIKSVEGPNLIIQQTKECMDKMGEWCQNHHGASGLTKNVLQSKITENEAEKQVIEFVKENVGAWNKFHLAGNSVYVDLQFLKKYMPTLASMFPHTLVDVSSISVLCGQWYPRDKKKAPKKAKNHRALDDIKESIKELEFYRDNIFKAKKRK